MTSTAPQPAGQEQDPEARAWQDAHGIACNGASNPLGVAAALAADIRALRAAGTTTPAVKGHPALRAIAAHLAYLFGHGSGPDPDLLRLVEAHAGSPAGAARPPRPADGGQDVLSALLDAATGAQDQAIRDATAAGLLWHCPACGWWNPAAAVRCEAGDRS